MHVYTHIDVCVYRYIKIVHNIRQNVKVKKYLIFVQL